MDRIKSLEAFVRVADLSSFTKAAESLNSSRATVTRLVLDLENELNIRLLNRTTRSVSLTSDGERLYEEARQALSAIDTVFAKKSNTDTLKGSLRVASTVSFAEFFLAQALEDFSVLHPELLIELVASDDIVPLVESRIDIAFEVSHSPKAGTVSRHLHLCASVVCASETYVDRHGLPEAPEDLTDHCLLGLSGQKYWIFAKGIQIKKIPVNARLRFSTAPLVLAACLRGHGIACLPKIAAQEFIQAHRLVEVLPDWNLPVLDVYALFPTDRMIGQAAQRLFDFVETRLTD